MEKLKGRKKSKFNLFILLTKGLNKMAKHRLFGLSITKIA